MTANPHERHTSVAIESEDETPVTAESLIEEVSIDGMCGVY